LLATHSQLRPSNVRGVSEWNCRLQHNHMTRAERSKAPIEPRIHATRLKPDYTARVLLAGIGARHVLKATGNFSSSWHRPKLFNAAARLIGLISRIYVEKHGNRLRSTKRNVKSLNIDVVGRCDSAFPSPSLTPIARVTEQIQIMLGNERIGTSSMADCVAVDCGGESLQRIEF
jgi:hypothetical protein